MHVRRILVACLIVLVVSSPTPSVRAAAADALPRLDQRRCRQARGELQPIWRFFGADEPNYAYMKDGRKLLAALGQLGTPQVYFRTHNLLTTGDGTPALKWGSTNAYTEDAQGRPVYDWTIVDRIFDTYLQRGLQALRADRVHAPGALRPAGAVPARVAPGTALQRRLHRLGLSAEGLRQVGRARATSGSSTASSNTAAPRSRTGTGRSGTSPTSATGRARPRNSTSSTTTPSTRCAAPCPRPGWAGRTRRAGGDPFLRDFLEHCLRGTNHATGAKGTPLDFIAFHAKGAPKFVDGHVQMGIARSCRRSTGRWRSIASFPELKRKPIVIGESDPEGCAACQGPQLGYRNGTMYSSYTAASFARKHDLAEKHGVNLEGALTWAFEFEDQPYFAGFRALATNGVDLPVLNVFRMFGKMGGRRLAVTSSGDAGLDAILKDGVRGAPDVSALASLEGKRLAVMAWHYHDDDLPGADAAVELSRDRAPAPDGRSAPRALPDRRGPQQRLRRSGSAWARRSRPTRSSTSSSWPRASSPAWRPQGR